MAAAVNRRVDYIHPPLTLVVIPALYTYLDDIGS
jgi:hypothetical protein